MLLWMCQVFVVFVSTADVHVCFVVCVCLCACFLLFPSLTINLRFCRWCQGWELITIHEVLAADVGVTLVFLLVLYLNCGPKYLHVQLVELLSEHPLCLSLSLWKQLSTPHMASTHAYFLHVSVQRCKHVGLVCCYFVWVPCAASRGLCLTTNPNGSSDQCAGMLGGCNAEGWSQHLFAVT